MTTYSELQKQYMMKLITKEEYQKKKAAHKDKLAKYMKSYLDGELSKEDLLHILNNVQKQGEV